MFPHSKTSSAQKQRREHDAGASDLLRLAAAVCSAPIAIQLRQDADGKDRIIGLGLPPSCHRNAVDFCRQALKTASAVWIEDAQRDPALAAHPLVAGPAALRWCAIVRIAATDGRPLGMLCVAAPNARPENDRASAALRVLASQFAVRIELEDTRLRLGEAASHATTTDAELNRAADHVRGMLDSAIDAIVAIDLHGRITHFNHAAEAMFGIPATDAIGAAMVDLIVPEQLREGHLEGMRRHLETGASTVLGKRIEIEAQRSDGSIFPVEIAISRIGGDRTPAFTAFLRDITEQKRSRTRAEADLRAKTEFLSRLSHDIRTPLNGIIGLTDLAIEAETADDRDAYLRMMRDGAYGLLEAVNGILDYSKIEAVGVEAVIRGFSPETTLTETLKTLAARARAKSLDFRVIHRGLERGRLLGDPGFLRQIAYNLVINAIRFTDHGYVRVITRTRPAAGGRVAFTLTVEDSGIGIAESEHQRIFEAFTQAHETRSQHQIGTGLGLAIVRRLVDALGGRIELESTPGRGSRFTVLLEFEHDEYGDHAATEAATEIATAGVSLPTPSQLHILVVDDNDTNRLVAGRLLARHGYRVTEVASGPEALAVAAEHRPSLVLMDLRLPGMNGLEAMAAIRTLPGCAQIPAIALTAHALVGDRERFVMMGMEGYVAKPFSGEVLLAEMDRVLGMASMRRIRAPTQGGSERFSRMIDSLDGNPRLFAIVARKASQEFRDSASELPQRLRQRDWPWLIEQIHKLKGSWPLYATPEHAMLADRCMTAVSRRNITATREPLAALVSALRETAQDLDQWLERYRGSQ
jgi:PAS domain S-box-containing protein